jgi:hypothetical protein
LPVPCFRDNFAPGQLRGSRAIGLQSIGAPIRRQEDCASSTGKGRHVDDLRETNAALGYVLRSPHAPACILALDVVRAKFFFLAGFLVVAAVATLSPVAWSADLAPEVLAFYYGWYGNRQLSGEWRHWKNVDPANVRIEKRDRLSGRRPAGRPSLS